MRFTRSQKKRLIAIIAGVALFLIGGVLSLSDADMAAAILFIAAGVFAGATCVIQAVRGILAGDFFDENMLMTIAAIGAVLLGEYPECAAIMILYQVGELFQSIAVGRSRRAISALSNLYPDTAELLGEDGKFQTVPTMELAVGDTIRIAPGGRIPADCEILSGNTAIDTSPVTGESMPRDAGPGETVYSGCLNKNGMIQAKVLRPVQDSAAGRIMKLTETAGERKTRSEAFITRFAKIYTPAVTGIAAAIAFLVPLVICLADGTPYGNIFPDWGRRALSMLVISCPCALVISVPLGYFCGLGNASKNGVLIKGSAFLDTMAAVDIAVFDKTGTLTMGTLTVENVRTEGDITESQLLSIAAAAEQHSSHPIAKAICAAAGDFVQTISVQETAGTGVEAILSDGRTVRVGRPQTDAAHTTAVQVCINGCPAGTILFADVVNPTAKEALHQLKTAGVEQTAILTGDNAQAAGRVKESVGADIVYAQLLPEEKFEKIETLCESGKKLLYVGDGINDTPALARADIGVAIGVLGSDAAVDTADAVLMDTDLTRLAYGVRLARKTLGIVRSNITFSLTAKLLVLLLAALNQVGMWGAVLADVGVSILAVSNSMRLLRYGNKR